MDDVVIVGAVRTAVGKFGGSLAKMPAPQLGAAVIRALLARTGVAPELVNEVLLGQVLTAGSGQNPARQAAIFAGLPDLVPAMTINTVCAEGRADTASTLAAATMPWLCSRNRCSSSSRCADV